MAVLLWEDKDPDEVLDYRLDWAARLAGDTIQSSTWIVPAGITKDSDTHDTTTTTIWLSSGVLGEAYIFTNRVITAGGRTLDSSVKLKVRAK